MGKKNAFQRIFKEVEIERKRNLGFGRGWILADS